MLISTCFVYALFMCFPHGEPSTPGAESRLPAAVLPWGLSGMDWGQDNFITVQAPSFYLLGAAPVMAPLGAVSNETSWHGQLPN